MKKKQYCNDIKEEERHKEKDGREWKKEKLKFPWSPFFRDTLVLSNFKFLKLFSTLLQAANFYKSAVLQVTNFYKYISRVHQCDQTARLNFQYLAIFSNENLPKSIPIVQKRAQINLKYIAKDF